MDKLKVFLTVHKQSFPFSGEKRKMTVILIVLLLLIVAGGFITFQKFTSSGGVAEEIDISFDPEGPYALLLPRRDGNALILNLKRTATYDSISYELAYTADADEVVLKGKKSNDGESIGAIDRGVVGEIDTKQKKGEYEQEILFGTCSKNVCKYDKGVENGTLTLHIRKGNKAYRMTTQWHIEQPDVSLGILTSGDNHFTYSVKASREELSLIGYTIINNLTGSPKLPEGKEVSSKVYALSTPIAKDLMPGDIVLELSDNPWDGATLAVYSDKTGKWQELDTKVDDNKLSAKAPGAGIFAVLVPKK